jgi:phage repressor protein C with HTH and peptisase S24 domain
MDHVRKLIARTAKERGLTYKELSLAMGRNHAYLQQFIERDVPALLKERDRSKLAEILGLSEVDLGAPVKKITQAVNDNISNVPEYRVHVSAGGGSMVASEDKRRDWPFASDYLRNELGLDRAKLAMLEVRGDSMEPTLSSGDRVMVNMSDRQVSQPGIFVLYDGDGTVIKRVEKIPYSDPEQIVIKSDNPAHGTYTVLGELVNIVGRVVWAARRL